MLKFGTKNALGIFGLDFQKNSFSDFKSGSSSLPNCKVFRKNKNS